MGRYYWVKAISVFCAGLFMCGVAQGGAYSGGNGSLATPYQIGSSTDWLEMMNTSADWDKYFELIADIDFGGATIRPVGSSAEAPFTGVFDGKDFVIRNGAIRKTLTDNIGLFGYCSNAGGGGMVKGVRVENMTIQGSNNVGLLVGYTSGEIQSCIVSGTVSGKRNVGGLAGFLEGGTISDVQSSCTVTGERAVGGVAGGTLLSGRATEIQRCLASGSVTALGTGAGGVVGENDWDGVITDSYASSTVIGDGVVGGLAGSNKGMISFCFAVGDVTGLSDVDYMTAVGGLVGLNSYGNISFSYATGTVTGREGIGGLVGVSQGGDDRGIIRSCFATGAVNGILEVGGLVGNALKIIACYATGTVMGESQVGGLCGDVKTVIASYAVNQVSGISCVGGLVGSTAGCRGWDCFWDVDISGTDRSPAGKGLTSTQMREVLYYSAANWSAWEWVMEAGALPRLDWESTGAEGPLPEAPPLPYAGSGTPSDPYQITTAAEFAWMSWNIQTLDKHFRLMNTIDLDGVPLYPIGDHYGRYIDAPMDFTGVFEGAGNSLLNSSVLPGFENCNTSFFDSIGLFSSLGETGVIRNLTLNGAKGTVLEYVGQVGLLAGISYGKIFNCHVTGEFSGGLYEGVHAGAVVSRNNGEISSCSADLTSFDPGDSVFRKGRIGGIAATNDGRIEDTYAILHGSSSNIGGITGENSTNGEIENCHTNTVLYGDTVGGIAAWGGGVITRSSSNSQITDRKFQNDSYCGGIVGKFGGGEVSSCFATGTVTGGHFAGGLIGKLDMFYNVIIKDLYSRSLIRDRDPESTITDGPDGYYGGIIGRTEGPGDIINCYAACVIRKYRNESIVGGLIGHRQTVLLYGDGGFNETESDPATVTACYWDRQVSGVYNSDGGVGRNTRDMTYPHGEDTYAGWDFEGLWAADPLFTENDGYPWLPIAEAQGLPRAVLHGVSSIEENEYTVLSVAMEPNKESFLVNWYLNGVLIQSGPEMEYVIPRASDPDAGTYYAVVVSGDGAYYRSQDFLVRVFPEGSLPALSLPALLFLAVSLMVCAAGISKKTLALKRE